VYTGIDRETGNEVTWRVIRADKRNSKDFVNWYRKLDQIEGLRHPQVVSYLYSELRSNEVILIEEMVTAGSLRSFLKTFNNPKVRVCQSWFLQVLNGLQYLHSKRMIHGKLSCSHIYLNTNTGDIKIGDLAVSHLLKTARWNLLTPRDDIRNFGICLLEVAITQLFIQNSQLKEYLKSLYDRDVRNKRQIEAELLGLIKSKNYKSLVETCLSAKEVDIASLKRHKFFMHEYEGYISDIINKSTLHSPNRIPKQISCPNLRRIKNRNRSLLNVVIRHTVDSYEKVISFTYNMKEDTILGIAEEMKIMEILPEEYIWTVVLQIHKAGII
jgi:serine/threonine protein kinase